MNNYKENNFLIPMNLSFISTADNFRGAMSYTINHSILIKMINVFLYSKFFLYLNDYILEMKLNYTHRERKSFITLEEKYNLIVKLYIFFSY